MSLMSRLETEAVAQAEAPLCDNGGCMAQGSHWMHDGSWLCERCRALYMLALERERRYGTGGSHDRQLRP